MWGGMVAFTILLLYLLLPYGRRPVYLEGLAYDDQQRWHIGSVFEGGQILAHRTLRRVERLSRQTRLYLRLEQLRVLDVGRDLAPRALLQLTRHNWRGSQMLFDPRSSALFAFTNAELLELRDGQPPRVVVDLSRLSNWSGDFLPTRITEQDGECEGLLPDGRIVFSFRDEFCESVQSFLRPLHLRWVVDSRHYLGVVSRAGGRASRVPMPSGRSGFVNVHNGTLLEFAGSCSEGRLQAWTLDGRLERSYDLPGSMYYYADISDDGRRVLLSTGSGDGDEPILILDLVSGEQKILPFGGKFATWAYSNSVAFVREAGELWISRDFRTAEALAVISLPSEGRYIDFGSRPVMSRDRCLLAWQCVLYRKQGGGLRGTFVIDLRNNEFRTVPGAWSDFCWGT